MSAITLSTATTHDDITDLVASVAELFREDAGRHEPIRDLGWPAREGLTYYSGLVHDPACLPVLARQDGLVIGHLVGKLIEPGSMMTVRIAVLESIRVAPDSRSAGTGTMLVRHFLAWAADRGAEQASVTAYAANRGAQRFYERHGFVPMTVTSRAAV